MPESSQRKRTEDPLVPKMSAMQAQFTNSDPPKKGRFAYLIDEGKTCIINVPHSDLDQYVFDCFVGKLAQQLHNFIFTTHFLHR